MRVARFYYDSDWTTDLGLDHINNYTLMKMVILSGDKVDSLSVDNLWEHAEYKGGLDLLEVIDNGKYVAVSSVDCGGYDAVNLPISDALPLIIEWSEKYSSQTAQK